MLPKSYVVTERMNELQHFEASSSSVTTIGTCIMRDTSLIIDNLKMYKLQNSDTEIRRREAGILNTSDYQMIS
jgi:hypothetical protein